MFTKFRLQNYRTHVDTTIELGNVNLIIGANNSGKSNLLQGLNFLGQLIRNADINRGLSFSEIHKQVHQAKGKAADSLIFSCEYAKNEYRIQYTATLELGQNSVRYIERISVFSTQEVSLSESAESTDFLILRKKLESQSISDACKKVCADFFRDLSQIYYFHFQPYFLKREASLKDSTPKNVNIPRDLGVHGEGFQALIKHIQEHESTTYNKFIGYLRRFSPNLNGIVVQDHKVRWQFITGYNTLLEFSPEELSDGLLKAGGIAMLCAMEQLPSLILLEDVEESINYRKLSEFLFWIFLRANEDSRVILTSHDAATIREFNDRLECVYNVTINEPELRSTVISLNDYMLRFADMGFMSDDSGISTQKRNGTEKRIIAVSKAELTDSFFNGVLATLQ